MHRFFVVLTVVLVLLCSLTIQTASAQRPDWTLYVKTGGAPGEKKFEVTFNHKGALSVTSDDPTKMPGPTISKLAVNLSPSDTQAVYEQALKALREFEFPKVTEELYDGTNLTVSLTVHRRTLSIQVFHLSILADDVPEVAKLLALLNKHLPKEDHIY